MAFSHPFDMIYSLKYDIECLTRESPKIKMFADSFSFFDILLKATIHFMNRVVIDQQDV